MRTDLFPRLRDQQPPSAFVGVHTPRTNQRSSSAPPSEHQRDSPTSPLLPTNLRGTALPHLSSYYDMRNFGGRLQYNWALCNPLNLRWNRDAVQKARAVLGRHAAGAAVPSDELQRAQTVLAVSAPQGSLAPMPCRTAGWGLATVPVMWFMISSARYHPSSVIRIVIGQWLNQTLNALITYNNRPPSLGSGDAGQDDQRAAAAYLAACAAAIPIAVGSALAAQRFAPTFARFAPYPGVALANTVNTCLMRSEDWREGLPVYSAAAANPHRAKRAGGAKMLATADSGDGDERLVGRSLVAGRRAVAETALTRTLIPLANFVAVPIIVGATEIARGPGRPRSLALQLGVTAAVLVGAIPLASAVTPPIGTVDIDDLEPALARSARARDPSVRGLRYHRGF